MLSIEENEEYWVAVDQGRRALVPLVKRAHGYLERLTDIHRLDRLRYIAGHRAMKSNSNGTSERDLVFRADAWKLYKELASKTSQFYAEFDAFVVNVAASSVQLRTFLPAHEIDSLRGKLHPTAIESTCKVVLRTAERVEEFWTARPQSLAHEATPRNSGHDPEPDSQATPSRTDSTAVLRRLPLHLPVPKRGPSSAKMTREQWVDENWPSRLKQARGTDLQKVAAQRYDVSVETYKKWEQGVRPPARRYMDTVRQFTAHLESKT